MSAEDLRAVASAVNAFGEGEGPWADEHTIPFFAQDYVLATLRRARDHSRLLGQIENERYAQRLMDQVGRKENPDPKLRKLKRAAETGDPKALKAYGTALRAKGVLWDPLAGLLLLPFEIVRFKQPWDLYPHTVVQAGELATVMDPMPGGADLLLATHHPGLAEWDNRVMWDDGHGALEHTNEVLELVPIDWRPGEMLPEDFMANPDTKLRQLERAAAAGGPKDAKRYMRALAKVDSWARLSFERLDSVGRPVGGTPLSRQAVARLIHAVDRAPQTYWAVHGRSTSGTWPLAAAGWRERVPPEDWERASEWWGPHQGAELLEVVDTSIPWLIGPWIQQATPERFAGGMRDPEIEQPFRVERDYLPLHGTGFAVPRQLALLWAKANQ